MAAAEDGGLTGSMSADLTFATNYSWRGQVFNKEPVLQPSVTASSWGFSFNTWANFDVTDEGVKGEFTEVDLTLSWGREFGPVALEAGHIEYLLPNAHVGGITGTRELFLSASADVIVTPSLWLSYDYGSIDGLYANVGVGYGYGFFDWLGVDAGVGLGFGDSGYNKGYFGVDEAALNDLSFNVSANFNVIGPFSVAAGGTFAMLLDSEIKDAVEAGDGDPTPMYGWLTLSYAP